MTLMDKKNYSDSSEKTNKTGTQSLFEKKH